MAPRPVDVLILCCGSRGDTEPWALLAGALRAAGLAAAVAAHPEYAGLVDALANGGAGSAAGGAAGADAGGGGGAGPPVVFRPVGGSLPRALVETPEGAALRAAKGLAGLAAARGLMVPLARVRRGGLVGAGRRGVAAGRAAAAVAGGRRPGQRAACARGCPPAGLDAAPLTRIPLLPPHPPTPAALARRRARGGAGAAAGAHRGDHDAPHRRRMAHPRATRARRRGGGSGARGGGGGAAAAAALRRGPHRAVHAHGGVRAGDGGGRPDAALCLPQPVRRRGRARARAGAAKAGAVARPTPPPIGAPPQAAVAHRPRRRGPQPIRAHDGRRPRPPLACRLWAAALPRLFGLRCPGAAAGAGLGRGR
jgi:hypothetical protein